VHVVHDEDRRTGRELSLGSVGDVGDRPVQRVGERAGYAADRLAQRRQRAGREQVVAAARQHPYAGGSHVEEGADQARLAGAGLATDHHDRAGAAPRPGQGGVQRGQLGLALEEHPLLPPRRSSRRPAGPGLPR
jgi:hypothetical protein